MRLLIGQIQKIEPAIEKLLNDPKAEPAKLAKQLAEGRAEKDILSTRLVGRAVERYAALEADSTATLATAEKNLAAALEEWRTSRDRWRALLLEVNSKAAVQRIMTDNSLTPDNVRAARKKRSELQSARGKMETTLHAVSRRAFDESRKGYNWGPGDVRPTAQWFWNNAVRLAPELAEAAALCPEVVEKCVGRTEAAAGTAVKLS